mmetsp:Transcript_40545/g.49182  ORF Transcript_40545/g.49182 Transcript_40545/m.49182 type:complete len:210 (+) Transcript_40545:321-950(+)|eukprot:CAMPEP_0197854648 /NCGR_PEP_ID=MMETSP1438-20131217/25061_1 /TAXON_ID=1461541 /ORGANISM="Pterosperma sp., Strain CCMP1384" /LENGTH=209 /DNA_ID=CAMNT_0043469467 /DNA_START=300 /DNA_END=929 /DNA_ORIENTATION=+
MSDRDAYAGGTSSAGGGGAMSVEEAKRVLEAYEGSMKHKSKKRKKDSKDKEKEKEKDRKKDKKSISKKKSKKSSKDGKDGKSKKGSKRKRERDSSSSDGSDSSGSESEGAGKDKEKGKEKGKEKATGGFTDLVADTPPPPDYQVEEISKDDYYLKNHEFSMWLRMTTGKYFTELVAEETRRLFDDFVVKWNAKELPYAIYQGVTISGRR